MSYWIVYRTIIIVALAFATLAVALKAAHLWLEASKVEAVPEPVASIEDAPGIHILGAKVELGFFKASAIANRRAAKWTGLSAVVAAATTLAGTMLPLLDSLFTR